MSNKRQIRNSVAFSAVSALMISGVAVLPVAAYAEIEVTNCLDSGAGSLRAAVENAGLQDIILANDLDCNLITLDKAIRIPTSVTIVGPGAAELSISNNSTNNNGLFVFDSDVEEANVLFMSMTLTTHSVSSTLAEPLIFSEGENLLDLSSVEVTGAKSERFPLIATNGIVRIGESSFHGNRVVGGYLIGAASVYVANSSFVGNSLFEGALIYSNQIALLNSAFVDNYPEALDAQEQAPLFATFGDFNSYSSIFAEEFITSEEQFVYAEGGGVTDLGSNYYAFDSSVTDVYGVTNTTVGNGNSTLVSSEDLKLGTFGRVVKPATNELSPNHQQLSVGSVAIDSHTLEQFEVANLELAMEFNVFSGAARDGSGGDRRPAGPKYDSGPIEFVGTATSQLERRSKNVLFNPMSSTLTKEARKTLRNMVNNLPEGVTVRRINVTGFVQPAGFSWNNKSLSEARARNVKRFLKTLGVKGQWKVTARGEDKDSSAKARRVKVVVSYDLVPQPPR